jgi:hypothetical protein
MLSSGVCPVLTAFIGVEQCLALLALLYFRAVRLACHADGSS